MRILDNFQKPVHLKGKPSYLQPDAELVEGDVRDKTAVERALDGIDAVFHLAAYQDYMPDFSRFFHVNSVGTALLYEVAVERRMSLQKIVVASSQAVYGEGRYRCGTPERHAADEAAEFFPDIRPEAALEQSAWEHYCPACGSPAFPQQTDESRINPQNQYAVSKYTQELISLNIGKRYAIPTVALRYSIVQGPRQSFYNAYSGACRIFSLNYHFGKAPSVYEDGEQLRDFVNIQDVVAANLLVLESDAANDAVFNVGGGRTYTVSEFAEIVRDVFASDLHAAIPGEYRFGDTRHIVSDVSRLRALGWEPKHTARDSVTAYASWLQSQSNVDDVLAYAERKMKEMDVVRSVAPDPGGAR